MACNYDAPGSAKNPNRTVATLGGVELRRVKHWNWVTCTTTTPGFTKGGTGLTSSFEGQLDYWSKLTQYLSREYGGWSYRSLNWIGHLGGYNGSRTSDSYHLTGEALDIGWLQWNGTDSRPCYGKNELKSTSRNRRYLAVEATLRKNFGFVLNRHIPAHHNHFHVDRGCSVAMHTKWYGHSGWSSRQYRSTAYFIQDCVDAFMSDFNIGNDGKWGNQTESAFNTLKSRMGMHTLSPKTNVTHYQIFLTYIAMHGFANKSAGHYRYSTGGGPQ